MLGPRTRFEKIEAIALDLEILAVDQRPHHGVRVPVTYRVKLLVGTIPFPRETTQLEQECPGGVAGRVGLYQFERGFHGRRQISRIELKFRVVHIVFNVPKFDDNDQRFYMAPRRNFEP